MSLIALIIAHSALVVFAARAAIRPGAMARTCPGASSRPPFSQCVLVFHTGASPPATRTQTLSVRLAA